MRTVPRDPWFKLARHTSARIALGRAGSSMPTTEVLAFALAHAQARDAVHAALDRTALAASLGLALGAFDLPTIDVDSASATSADRKLYLRRPELGRRLADASRARLALCGTESCDVAVVVGDGLSALAVQRHSSALLAAFLPRAAAKGWRVGPIALASGARVALGDEIGQVLGARLVVMLIGERPGLSASDSLGVYVTYAPRPGRTDAERNCISNVRPGGLMPSVAAATLAWLVEAALLRQMTGVSLKDESKGIATCGDKTVLGSAAGGDGAGSDPQM